MPESPFTEHREPAVSAPPAWYVYLLECADASLYCGITTDVPRRVAQHNGELAGGAKYTRARRPVLLRACAPCANRSAASKLERHIQKLRREHKLSYVLSLTS